MNRLRHVLRGGSVVDSQTLLPVILISCHSLCKRACLLYKSQCVCVLACERRRDLRAC